MVGRWPEGSAADPEAARKRYDSDTRATRKALREVFRVDLPDAHSGPGIVIAASVVVGLLLGPAAGALVAGAFAFLLLATLAVMFLRRIRGVDATRRAYLFASGWAGWVQEPAVEPCDTHAPGDCSRCGGARSVRFVALREGAARSREREISAWLLRRNRGGEPGRAITP